ncbi:hypothetical protein AQ925_04200 [Burkholderia pseudomallei]|nr:hypothetical protein AQ922_21810 [Burkholderia pseudomallei]ONC98042.1 hypothetical protein AQ925_04200 [Burkholderia pseudomallei]OND00246.1 hypothetical protein AQ926_12415 [Burkholderia pseudomallei]OND07023.1 hypothetical protein AQ928_09215 [Burkholderia pseudomallei]OND12031.1 hypothetical protein AQ929_08345 [Burkholderia pseudomallei]
MGRAAGAGAREERAPRGSKRTDADRAGSAAPAPNACLPRGSGARRKPIRPPPGARGRAVSRWRAARR